MVMLICPAYIVSWNKSASTSADLRSQAQSMDKSRTSYRSLQAKRFRQVRPLRSSLRGNGPKNKERWKAHLPALSLNFVKGRLRSAWCPSFQSRDAFFKIVDLITIIYRRYDSP